jgi:LuxR family transcriptional regulator, maltose regulon positive regulatory protein
VADVFAAGTGLLDFGRQALYGPPREVLEEATQGTTTAGPQVPDYFIERPRLTRLLDEATAPVIMLIAPAGFGKTTLARQWLASRRRGWYRGSPAAADVAALAVGLARSVGSIVPDAGRRMGERLRATGTPEKDVEPLAELLAEDLAEWPEDAWLAFDDYQFASESPFAEEFVARVLALCPLKLFLTSRKRPSWATSRRLLYGDIYEIGRSLLAMSQEEAEQVLADRRGSEASGLVALADGWPAVIGLAALTDEIELPDDGVPEALYEYFAEELYQAADPELRWSLSQLSLSSTVAPAVAEAVLGDEAERALLDGRRIGFLVPSEQGVDEIHPLLRVFLEEKFRELAGDRAPAIVELVVRTHLAREEWDDAFSIVERFFDAELLVEVVETALPRVLLEARLPTLARWVECAVQHEVDAPVFDLAEGELAFRAADRTRSEALGLQAARRFEEGHPLVSRSFALAGASAHLSYQDEIALDYFGKAHATARASDDVRHSLWGHVLAHVALERDAACALNDFEAQATDSVDDQLRLANGRLLLGALSGGFNDAVEAARLLAPLTDRVRDPLIHTSFLNSYASALVLCGDYSRALRLAEDEIKQATDYRLQFVLPHAHVYKAAALWGLRRFRQCVICLDQSQRLNTDPDDGLLLMNIGAIKTRLQLSLGSPAKALAALEKYEHDRATLGMEAEYKAWWSLALACADQPAAALRTAKEAEGMTGRVEVCAVVPWTRATVASIEGKRTARALAARAFQSTLEIGNVDAFVAAYRAHPKHLAAVVANRACERDVRRIVQRAMDARLARKVGLSVFGPEPSSARDALSPREREVLDLVVQGATNREMATALFITETTVKVHLRHIYEKLGVRSRTEAAVRALEDD